MCGSHALDQACDPSPLRSSGLHPGGNWPECLLGRFQKLRLGAGIAPEAQEWRGWRISWPGRAKGSRAQLGRLGGAAEHKLITSGSETQKITSVDCLQSQARRGTTEAREWRRWRGP